MNAEVAEKGKLNTPDEVREVFRDRKNITYVEDYSLTSNPNAILGNGYYQEVGSDEFFRCHTEIAVNRPRILH